MWNYLILKIFNKKWNQSNFKSFIKYWSNGGSNDKNNLPRKLLTNTQVSKLRKDFANNSSANTKLSKTQLHKIVQLGGFLGRIFGTFLKNGLPLIGNVLKP